MKNIIKSFTYNVINTDPFEMPRPLDFSLMSGNSLIASYTIHENGQVDYRFNSSAKDPVLTSTVRPLEMNDIYFLFSSRVFQDKTPYTAGHLERFDLEEYNPYEILRKTHGVMPIDRYWIKFSDDDEHFNYKKAAEIFASFYENDADVHSDSADNPENAGIGVDNEILVHSFDSIMNQKSNEYTSINDVSTILNESKLDVESVIGKIDNSPVTETIFSPADFNPFEKPKSDETVTADVPSEPAETESSGGNMSPEAIAAMLANVGNGDSDAVSESSPETTSDESSDSFNSPSSSEYVHNADKQEQSGGNMSPEAIAAMLAAVDTAPAPEPTPEPEPA
ncbi:MAG: hypothetical protein FWF82_07785, partial [Oscillospiraceae bacterium]|nr:hypothetical protein [Oscillospiraceae bacterium]